MSIRNRMVVKVLIICCVFFLSYTTYAAKTNAVTGPHAKLLCQDQPGLDFAGRAKSATIYPLGDKKDHYLIVIHKIKKITVIRAHPTANKGKEIPIHLVPDELWLSQHLTAAVFGYFSHEKGGLEKYYLFRVSHPSYHPKSHTFQFHAVSISSPGIAPFSAKHSVKVKNFKFYIDPLKLTYSGGSGTSGW